MENLKKNPKISIIVPIYKVENHLEKCINSILNQTFRDFELILVNDGSPDNCGNICDLYKERDSRIKVIHKKNGGLSSARNAGLDIAKGDYIGFVDSDDYINKNMYEVLYNIAKNDNSDIVICDYKSVNKNNENYDDSIEKKYEVSRFNNIEALNELYSDNNIIFTVAWNKIYKRYLFNNLRYELGKLHEDEFIIHKILYNSNKISFVKYKLYYYLQTENSIMRSQFNIKKLQLEEALEDRIRFFKLKGLSNLKYKAEVSYIKNTFKLYIRANNEFDKSNENFKRFIKNMRYRSISLLRNPYYLFSNSYYNIKEKMAILIFSINPLIYNKFWGI